MTQRNPLKHHLAPVSKGELISHGRSQGFRGPFSHLLLTYRLTLNKSTLFHSQYLYLFHEHLFTGFRDPLPFNCLKTWLPKASRKCRATRGPHLCVSTVATATPEPRPAPPTLAGQGVQPPARLSCL